MQPVSQFDDDHTDVFCHCKEHLPKIFRLDLQLILRIRQLSQLCNAVHKKSHLFSEFQSDFIQCHVRIFHGVMQHPRHDRLFIHLQIRKDDPHPERMDDIRFARFSRLPVVRFRRCLICFFDHGNIRRRMIFPDTFDQCLI